MRDDQVTNCRGGVLPIGLGLRGWGAVHKMTVAPHLLAAEQALLRAADILGDADGAERIMDAIAHVRLALADQVDRGAIPADDRFDRTYLSFCLDPPAFDDDGRAVPGTGGKPRLSGASR